MRGFFFTPPRLQAQVAQRFVHFDELPDQILETMIVLDLLPGSFQSMGGNAAIDRLVVDFARQLPSRMAAGAFLGAVARRFAAFAEVRGQTARSEFCGVCELFEQ